MVDRKKYVFANCVLNTRGYLTLIDAVICIRWRKKRSRWETATYPLSIRKYPRYYHVLSFHLQTCVLNCINFEFRKIERVSFMSARGTEENVYPRDKRLINWKTNETDHFINLNWQWLDINVYSIIINHFVVRFQTKLFLSILYRYKIFPIK